MICLFNACVSPRVAFKTKRRESLTLSGPAERAHLCSTRAGILNPIACKAAKQKASMHIKIFL